MLDEYKQIYTDCADLILNWKSLSKSDLANLYIEHEKDEISNSYLSALILKFWNLISHFYYKQGIKTASEDDCYNWIIEGISNALKHRVWTNPNNKLYNDKKGPEKAIMVHIMSTRANYYQGIKYDKRSLNYNNLSLEALEEISSDGFFIPYNDTYIDLEGYIQDNIKTYFDKDDYFSCFVLDLLFNYNLIDVKKDYSVSIRKFNNYVDKLNEIYLQEFSYTYNIELDKVKSAFNKLKLMPSYKIHSKMNDLLNKLRNDETLKELLLEGRE